MAGRREAPLDPAEGPVQRFAYELRKLRQEAGGPTYRAMARQSDHGASTLSQAAAGERLPTLPVVLAYVRACGGDTEEWERRWRQAAEEDAAEPRAEDGTPEPYRGLARFELDDAALYFGRDQLIEDVLRLTRARRLAAVVGASGSGKSSLLRAGLIPRLRTADDPRPAGVRIITPGEHPLRDRDRRLTPKDATSGDTWLIVDQFEELYTLCTDPAERTAFIDLLLEAMDPGSGMRVLISVRADFFGNLAGHQPLADALRDATLLTPPMNGDELREAIVRPAQATGLIVERALTARVIAEVEGEPGGLPLMSHALLETWRRRKGRALTMENYEASGGLHGAIARTAEEVHGRFSPAQADIAQSVLLRLISPGDGTPDTRRPTRRDELDFGEEGDTATVIERLALARLVTLDGDTIDLAHEALITAWPRLRGWIDAERDRLRVHRRLTEAATTWRDLGRDPGALYRGARLTVAREVFSQPGWDARLIPLEREFLRASGTALTRERRRRHGLVTTLSLLLVASLVAGVVAWQQNRTSDERRVQAAARRVAAVAENLRYSDPVTAMRLSLAAWRTAPTTETRSALLGAMEQREEDRFAPVSEDLADQLFLSDDGRVLVQATGRQVTTWDVSGHRRTGRYPGIGDDWDVSALSPDGRRLALSGDGGLILWDVAQGHRVGPPLSSRWPTTAVFGPSGRTVLADDGLGGGTVTVRLWDLDRRRTLLQQRVPGLRKAAVSRDDRLVGLCPEDGRIRLWRVAGQRPVTLRNAYRVGESDECAVAFSPDGRRVTFGVGERAGTWDTATSRRIDEFRDNGSEALRYTEDGKFLVTSGQEGIQVWWRPVSDDPVFQYATTADSASDFSIGPGARFVRYIADAGPDTGAGRAVRTVSLGNVVHQRWTTDPATGMWLGPDGATLATARPSHGQERFRFVDVRSGRDKGNAPGIGTCSGADSPGGRGGEPATSCYGLVAFAANGRSAAYTLNSVDEPGSRQRVVLWREGSGPAELTLTIRPRALVRRIALSPDGSTLAVSLRRGADTWRSEVWDVRTRTRTRVVKGVGGDALTISPDGRWLVTSDGHAIDLTSPSARVRRLSAGAGTSAVPAAGGAASWTGVEVMAFSPDGRYLAAGDHSGRVTLLDGGLSKRLGTMSGLITDAHQDSAAPVTALRFAHDSHTLAVAGLDGTLRLWDAAANQPLGSVLPTPSDPVQSVAFSRDDGTVTVASDHIPSQTYRVSDDQAAVAVCERARGGLSRDDWERMIPEVPYRRLC
ncbi:DNA-binding protein [Streptomyces sp. NPDC019937]|uniref:nSTAND1 domain-containing NTPase n=1 Tax=Streptomyces sp. NPDC019937 TaxID=3154787 RepID=UPI0033F4BF05